MRAPSERGSVLFIVMVILAALFAGGVVILHLELSNTRKTALVRSAKSSLYCAEAGLQVARPVVMANVADWNTVLSTSDQNPAWYGPDGLFGEAGWQVWITDDDDEFPAPDPTRDNNLRVVVHSRCLLYPEYPSEVMEIIEYASRGKDYEGKCKGGQCLNDETN